MLIYRVEDQDGLGPFRGSLADDAFYAALEEDYNVSEFRPNRHPCPITDGGQLGEAWEHMFPRTYKMYYFGFRSLDQLTRWFDHPILRKHMSLLGGMVVVYSVHDDYVLHGEYQVAFPMVMSSVENVIEIPN